MSDTPATPANVFIVYPENQKLVSGEISFQEHRQGKLRNAVLCFIVAPTIGGILWLFFTLGFTENTVWNVFPSLLFTLIFVGGGISEWYAARLHRQLAVGQWLDGQVVSSKLYTRNQGKGIGFLLNLTYQFQTPDGDTKQHTVEVRRFDLFREADKRYRGIRHISASKIDYQRLQEFAPPAGTPVKVRYVNDSLFRVM